MTDRIVKINHLLCQEVGRALHEQLRFPDGVLVTVMSADTSRTLEHTTIKISIFPKPAASTVLKSINSQIYLLQQTINKRLAMHPIPKITFRLDDSTERIAKVEQILEKIIE